jgi:hypothetical protein
MIVIKNKMKILVSENPVAATLRIELAIAHRKSILLAYQLTKLFEIFPVLWNKCSKDRLTAPTIISKLGYQP